MKKNNKLFFLKSRTVIVAFLMMFALPNILLANTGKITIKMKQATLSSIFKTIKDQSTYNFAYSNSDINTNKTVDVDVENGTIEEVLAQALKGQSLTYVIEGNQIVLSPQKTNNASKSINVSGLILDPTGDPVIGANVMEEGTTNGTITDIDGKFTLKVNSTGTLTVSFIGYNTEHVAVNNQKTITVKMQEQAGKLDEVIVTALGIQKKASSLTYTAQQLDGDELNRNKDVNLVNSLTGKVAGVQINRSASGLGGSAKISIRGTRSINGSNQPLYVIDGVPMLNTLGEQAVNAIGGTADGANRDGGDGISNLNPDDIASMSILRGASASALYGSQAANGVIIITTKKGQAGVSKVQFSSNVTFDNVISTPKFQNRYGQGADANSWGELNPSMTQYDNVDSYFRTGVTAINSLSFTAGNQVLQSYVSYSNTSARGVVDLNTFQKNNLNVRETAKFFKDKLTIDANINIMNQKVKNRPSSGGIYMNPLVGLYRFPRGRDISEFRTGFEQYNPLRNFNTQNWYTSISEWDQNPYWLLNRVQSDDSRTRAIASVSANLQITDWLKLQARGTYDVINDKFTNKVYASTAVALTGENGRYIDYKGQESLLYGDVLLMGNKTWDKFSLNVALGASINDSHTSSTRIDSKTSSLYFANVFTVSNIIVGPSAYIEEVDAHQQTQSVFGTAQLGYKESLYLDLTARNDWSSALARTKSLKTGFFYPSVGVSWIISSMFNLPQAISFSKVRASWSQVGNTIPIYVSNPVDHIGAGGQPITSDTGVFDNLKPEMTTSYEVGTEWRFFNNRIDFDFTYYRTNTRNQYFRLPSSAGATNAYYSINAGNIQNEGFEATLGFTPVLTKQFSWKSNINFSTNVSKVIKLHEELPVFVYDGSSTTSSYGMRLVEGGRIGDIYGLAFERDDAGNIVYDPETGFPKKVGAGNTEFICNSAPKFLLGWANTFSYKGFSLYMLIDGRFGGHVISQTEAMLDYWGVSKNTGDARDRGFVNLEGNKITDVEGFYKSVGDRSGVTEYYKYDATNIRLRELSVSYSFPKKILGNGFVKEASISFVGRNLLFFYKKAPFDPDAILSAGNNNQGLDVFGTPASRNLGFNLQITF